MSRASALRAPALLLRALALALLLAGCGSSAPRPTPTVDAEAARGKARELLQAIGRSDGAAVRATLSLADLSRRARPADLRTYGRATEKRFEDAALAEILDTGGAAHRLLAGAQLAEAPVQVQGDEAVVPAATSAGLPLRLVVASRESRLMVVRIE